MTKLRYETEAGEILSLRIRFIVCFALVYNLMSELGLCKYSPGVRISQEDRVVPEKAKPFARTGAESGESPDYWRWPSYRRK